MTEPQFVLVLLPPLDRRRRAADLQHQVVLVTRTDLAGRERSLCAVVEPDQHRCEILDRDVHDVGVPAAGCRKSLTRAARLLPLRQRRCDIAEDVCDRQPAHMLREIAPVRADVAQGR
jgi:hypothetical protein